MRWSTGNWTSVPDDGRAFLERHDDDLWYAYQTDEAADYQAKGLDLEEEQGALANEVSMGCKVEGSWDGTRPEVVKYDDVGPTFLYATMVTVRCDACQTQMKGVSTTEWACPNEACPEHGKPVVTGAYPVMREEGDDVVGG